MMLFDAATLVLSGVVVLLAGLLAREYIRSRERAEAMFERWRSRELERARVELTRSLTLAAEARLEKWKIEHEGRIRDDSVRRSQAVVLGKTTEHLLPFFPGFPFSPKDVRFLGSPVDLVVFDGMNAGELREIVFVEVKTGPSASLTTRERRIRDAVASGRVRFEEMRAPRPERGALSVDENVSESVSESLYLPLRSPDGDTTGQIEVQLETGEVRYWTDWSRPPEVYALSPDVVVRLEGRHHGLKISADGARTFARLTPELTLELDPEAGLMRFLSRTYELERERLQRRRGSLLLALDGGR
jgi:predicted Holliday junction resolvase-like endonuclease